MGEVSEGKAAIRKRREGKRLREASPQNHREREHPLRKVREKKRS